MNRHWISPSWPVPGNIKAKATLRTGGVSTGCYQSLNLGGHVGDKPEAVASNRARLKARLGLPSEPVWLKQVHGIHGVDAANPVADESADASYTFEPNVVCAVLTADCLPILLYNPKTDLVASVHGGWRGLLNGVVEATLSVTGVECLAWLGPAIGPSAFQVGAEVCDAFVKKNRSFEQAFKPQSNGKYQADIFEIARIIFVEQGVEQVFGGDYCTYSDSVRFFSHRRDGITGRMATMIWRESV